MTRHARAQSLFPRSFELYLLILSTKVALTTFSPVEPAPHCRHGLAPTPLLTVLTDAQLNFRRKILVALKGVKTQCFPFQVESAAQWGPEEPPLDLRTQQRGLTNH